MKSRRLDEINMFINDRQWPGKAVLGRLTDDEKELYGKALDYLDELSALDPQDMPDNWPEFEDLPMWREARLAFTDSLKALNCSVVPAHPWINGLGQQTDNGAYLSPVNAVRYLAERLAGTGAIPM